MPPTHHVPSVELMSFSCKHTSVTLCVCVYEGEDEKDEKTSLLGHRVKGELELEPVLGSTGWLFPSSWSEKKLLDRLVTCV